MMDVEELEHKDGVSWFDAPRPRRMHRCWAQTSARVDGRLVERCPCGAIRITHPDRSATRWVERNTRRRG